MNLDGSYGPVKTPPPDVPARAGGEKGREKRKPPHCPICGRFMRRNGFGYMCPLAYWDEYRGAWEHD